MMASLNILAMLSFLYCSIIVGANTVENNENLCISADESSRLRNELSEMRADMAELKQLLNTNWSQKGRNRVERREYSALKCNTYLHILNTLYIFSTILTFLFYYTCWTEP